MITQIEIENFKCFKNRVSFPLGKLTLLTGVNGRGKSTLLQSLLLMRQSIEHDENTDKILLNGSCVNLNTFNDIRNRDISLKNPVVIRYYFKSKISVRHLNLKNQENSTEVILKSDIQYHLIENPEDDMVAQICKINLYSELIENINVNTSKNLYSFSEVYTLLNNKEKLFVSQNPDKVTRYTKLFNLKTEQSIKCPYSLGTFDIRDLYLYIFFDNFHYISADRIGPKDFYPKSTLDKFPNVGARGEFTANLLYKKQGDLVDDKLCLGEDAKTLITQTEAWLSKIFGGAKLEIPSSQSSILELLFNTSASKDRFKPANVGFGFHSVLPIIVSGLIAKEGEILIVENPEIHLHPRAQSELTKFLAKVSSCGVQVLVESHSDHILNGLRIAVLDKIINSEDLSILYFQNDLENPVVQIPVQPDGGIEEWPDDFFDQTTKDFERLFGI